MNRLAAALAPLWLIASAAAQASNPGNQTLKNFKAMDQCAKEAQQAFPDFTTEAQDKRDTKLKECLASKNLPPPGEGCSCHPALRHRRQPQALSGAGPRRKV